MFASFTWSWYVLNILIVAYFLLETKIYSGLPDHNFKSEMLWPKDGQDGRN